MAVWIMAKYIPISRIVDYVSMLNSLWRNIMIDSELANLMGCFRLRIVTDL
jgi:hypothetical protein